MLIEQMVLCIYFEAKQSAPKKKTHTHPVTVCKILMLVSLSGDLLTPIVSKSIRVFGSTLVNYYRTIDTVLLKKDHWAFPSDFSRKLNVSNLSVKKNQIRQLGDKEAMVPKLKSQDIPPPERALLQMPFTLLSNICSAMFALTNCQGMVA